MRKTAIVGAIASLCLVTSAPVFSQTAQTVTNARSQLPDFVNLVEQYGPGVVNISTVQKARVIEDSNGFGGLDERHAEIFRRFGFPFPGVPFGSQTRPERRGTGSGFIISADGLILTNHHVVDGADEITVRMTDEREFKGKVLGSDKKTDIAVVKIEAKNLPVLKMGNSDALKVGEWVAAIGSPFGLQNTVTAGIVSAKSRRLPSDQYVPFIQTDVAVNPGNSGGPLFNMNGEVVGINSQIFSTSGGFMGLSFAIPIDLALQIKDQLVKHGKVTRGRIGVMIQGLSADLAESFGLEKPIGAVVVRIDKDGPAAKSDLRDGDLIIGVNGKDIKSSNDLPVEISKLAPGSTAKLSVLRDGKKLTVDVKVVAADNSSSESGAATAKSTGKLGVQVKPLTPDEAKKADTQGLYVVQSEGRARKAGIRTGDILVSCNGKALKTNDDLSEMLANAKGKVLRILLQRGSDRMLVPVKMN